jgi:hypothetical protein
LCSAVWALSQCLSSTSRRGLSEPQPIERLKRCLVVADEHGELPALDLSSAIRRKGGRRA